MREEQRRLSKSDGKTLHRLICNAWGIRVDGYKARLLELYDSGMSGNEISEFIKEDTGYEITPRSIQRMIMAQGKTRSVREAFQNAMKRGRVSWQMEEAAQLRVKNKQLPRGLRFRILERDGFRCTACGSSELLQVDHIVARVHGGGDEEKNLRVLCLDCNLGKREEKRESSYGGGFKHGGSTVGE